MDTNGNTSTAKVYYLFAGQTVAMRAGPSGTALEYFLTDALDSLRQLADATGVVTLARNYDPFGNPDGSLGSATTGEQTDSPINLMNFHSKQYDN